MLTRKLRFLGGMPRAGSTLIANILNQNPNIHATSTSGMVDVVFGVRNNFGELIEHKASPPPPDRLPRIMKAIMEAYYADIDRPIIIDKFRGACSLIDMLEHAFGEQVKIIVPVRDLRDILSSFELLWREKAKSGQVPGERENYFQMQTVGGRCEFWARADQPIGLAYNRIKDAVARDFKDRLHFVHFEKLTSQPELSLRAIYEFLEEDYFAHNFEHVEQTTKEDDTVFGFNNLHKIRTKVEVVPPRYPSVLGSAAKKYENANFWKDL